MAQPHDRIFFGFLPPTAKEFAEKSTTGAVVCSSKWLILWSQPEIALAGCYFLLKGKLGITIRELGPLPRFHGPNPVR